MEQGPLEVRRSDWRRDLTFAVLIFLLFDLTAAQVCKRVLDDWDPSGIERQYRIRNPQYHHDLATNVSLTARFGPIAYPVRTNSLGFRDAHPRQVALAESRPRVLFIGDSFTEGIGIPYEHTFVGLLDAELHQHGVEVLNAAVASYGFAIYRRKLEYLIETIGLKFSYLVVAVDVSDVWDDTHAYGVDRSGGIVTKDPTAERAAALRRFLRDNSVLLKVADVLKDRARDALTGSGAERSEWTQPPAFEEYGRMGLAAGGLEMDRLHTLMRRHEIGMAIVVYPWQAQIRARDTTSVHESYWKEWAKARGVAFFDLFPVFFTPPSPEVPVRANFIPHDIHWNREGHRLVASALHDLGLPDSIIGYTAARTRDPQQQNDPPC